VTATDDAVVAAREWQRKHFPGKGHVPVAPAKRLAVVACMDSRIDTFGLLGLAIGDAHILRNGGGVITDDVIRSLAVSQRKLGTEEILLVHHTDCGQTRITDEGFAEELERDAGLRPHWTIHAFTDPAEDVRESIRRIKDSPFIPHRDRVRGFVYDVDTGELREVN
jgi:carbonic anhydrase